MENLPKPVTEESHKKISEYLNDSIYEIKGDKGIYGKVFFCKIKIHDIIITVLITDYKTFNEEYLINNNNIEILKNKEIIIIERDILYYMNKELDISVIQIKENNKIKILEIDENIYKKESEMYLNKETIYIIYDKKVSYGIINNISKSEIIISCNLNNINKNRYPIFNLNSNKLIGIYDNNSKYYNKGIFIRYIINELEMKYNNNDNEIEIIMKIEKEDINNKIYFMDNKNEDHNNLKELNILNTKLYINNIENNYKKYFIPDNEIEYDIRIQFDINLEDCSYMFAG